MFELKPLDREAIPAALERVERYRLLNEPEAAESICRDILLVDSDNHEAHINFILSLTDQFTDGLSGRYDEAMNAVSELDSEYERAYYKGVVCERRAKAHQEKRSPSSGHLAYEWFAKAMDHFMIAEPLRTDGNDDAILRWNTCARIIDRYPHVQPADDLPAPLQLE
jgi:hypothetical protein